MFDFVTGNFSISRIDDYRDKWFHIFLDRFGLNLRISKFFSRLRPGDNSFLFDYNGFLDEDLFVFFGLNLPGDFYLFMRGSMANIFLNEFLLKFGLDDTGLSLKR